MDKDSKKAIDDKYGVPDEVEEFAAKVADKQDNPTLHELAKEFPDKTYKELEKYKNADRQDEATQVPLTEAQRNLVDHIEAGACIMGEMRKDREEVDSSDTKALKSEVAALKQQLFLNNEEAQRSLKNLEIRLAESLEVNESHQRLNGKLQTRLTELEEDHQKLNAHLHGRIYGDGKSGM